MVVRAQLPPTTGPVLIHYRDLDVLAVVIPEDNITELGARMLERYYRMRRKYYPDRPFMRLSTN
jgi:hypothetical protein